MISEKQKRLRRWFRNHKWHTNNTPANGVWLEMPVDDRKYYLRKDKRGEYHEQVLVGFEVDRFTCEEVYAYIYTRKVYHDSEEQEGWSNSPQNTFRISVSELKKLVEIAEVCKEETL